MNQSSSIAIIEHDIHGDNLVVWTFPGMNPILQNLCIKRCSVEGINNSFVYFKFKTDWVYIHTSAVPDSVSKVVNHASVCLSSLVFNPEKYAEQLSLMFSKYVGALDPTKALGVYLGIFSTGKYDSYDDNNYPDSNVFTNVSILKELYELFNSELVIVWNAVLLKKRIFVLCDQLPKLYMTIRSLPQLCFHRKDPSILRPLIRNDAESLEDLKTAGGFIAGSSDISLLNKNDLYDVLVNLNDHRIVVSTNSVEEMKMNSVHKELAALLQACSEAGGNSQELVKTISSKTNETISQLKALSNGNELTEDILRSKISNEASFQWLYRLALSEGII